LRKIRRIFLTMICFCLLSGSILVSAPKAYATSAMTASASCVEFIKEAEGFSLQPYYDYSQHTVGYGTKCPTEKYFDYMVNGIPVEEAEALLQEELTEIEDAISKKLMEPYNLTFSQHQFDALVSFSFNIGTGWMTYDSSLRNALLKGADTNELVYAFGLYSTAGGNYLPGLINRRLCEANMFLNGIYSLNATDAYGYVFYEPNGGSLTYRVQAFLSNSKPAPVEDAARIGDVFLGWYTDLNSGTRITELNSALNGKTLFARWQNQEDHPSPSTLVRVTGDVVNIRKGPGTTYAISKQVYWDDVLVVSQVSQLSNRKWGKVQDGWICLEYTNYDAVMNGTGDTDSETNGESAVPDNTPPLDPPADTSPGNQEILSGTVRVNDLLRIRSGPGTTYSTVGYLYNGNTVEILEQKTVGSMVWGRFTRGWVSMNYIVTGDLPADNTTEPETEPKPEETPEDSVGKAEPTAMNGKITADALRIRSGPGTQAAIVGFYYQNDPVTITEKILVNSAYWGKTDKGWIHMDYFAADSSNEASSQPTGAEMKTVIGDCLRIRKGAGTEYKIAALLYYGDTVAVYETKTVNGTVWGRVDQGWICMDYVN